MRSPLLKQPTRNIAPNIYAMMFAPIVFAPGVTELIGPIVVDVRLTGGGGSGGGGLPSATYGGATMSNNGERGGTAERNKLFANKFLPPEQMTLTVPSRISANTHSVTIAYQGVWQSWISDDGRNGISCRLETSSETLSAEGGIAGRGAYISELQGASTYAGSALSAADGYGGFGISSAYASNSTSSFLWRTANASGREGEATLTLKGN